jgi:hypothetical protein
MEFRNPESGIDTAGNYTKLTGKNLIPDFGIRLKNCSLMSAGEKRKMLTARVR